MLFKETTRAELFELTKNLCQEPELDQFILVGGTALSLQIGKRKSIDIDLFSATPFVVAGMAEFLQTKYSYKIQNRFKNSLLGTIQNIKVDIITHQYKWLRPAIVEEGIRMASLEDIASMKLNAIMGNGSRLKDYVDIAFLSSLFTLKQMLEFFETKYPDNNAMMAFKSLSWFDDINFDVDIQYVNKGITWEKIKERILNMVQNPEKKFPEL